MSVFLLSDRQANGAETGVRFVIGGIIGGIHKNQLHLLREITITCVQSLIVAASTNQSNPLILKRKSTGFLFPGYLFL